MTFTVIGTRLEIDGTTQFFSTHLAAFEAGMRIRNADWMPLRGRTTYFDALDADRFRALEKTLCL